MNDAQFHIKLLSNYQLVTKPGTYYVSVAYTVREINLIQDERPRYLVPLRAITTDGLTEIVEKLKDAKNGLIPFSEIRHVFLNGALWYGEGDTYDESDLPIKAEKVLAHFDYVELDSGTKLLCTNIELLPREELEYIDPDQFDLFRQTINNLITKSI
jgi:hypothetical protein